MKLYNYMKFMNFINRYKIMNEFDELKLYDMIYNLWIL